MPERTLRGIVLVGTMVLAGCNYSFRGGSFPDHIRTIAILPFDNETTRIELTQEIHETLLRELPRALGIRPGGEDVADAVIRGEITSYQISTPSYRPGAGGERAEVLQRQVVIGVTVRIIDRTRNEIFWESSGLRAEGQYLEAQGETEEIGKQEALEALIQEIVDGAQSTW